MKQNFISRTATFKRWSRASYGAFASLGRQVRIGVLATTMGIIALDSMAANVASDSTKVATPIDDSMRRGGDIETIRLEISYWGPHFDGIPNPTFTPIQTFIYEPHASIEDALRKVPIVDVRQRGARGVQADISVRGSSADQTMIMLNGVDFSDARTGHQSHSLPISLANIGSIAINWHNTKIGAYSGSLDYQTPNQSKNFLEAYAGGGSYGTYSVGASGAYKPARGLTLYGAVGYDHSDGYIDNTDYNRINLYFRGQYEHKKAGKIDFQLGYQDMNFGANGFYSLAYPMQWEATRTALGSVRYSKTWDKWTLDAMASYRLNTDRFELYRPRYTTPPESYKGGNYHITNSVGASVGVTRNWGDAGSTSLGAEFSYNDILSTVLGDKIDAPRRINGVEYNYGKQRSQVNYYVRHDVALDRFVINASATAAQTPYGVEPLGSLSVRYNPTSGLYLYVGGSRTMRLPTFTDLYYTTPTHVGNPNLVPEKATTASFGTSYGWGRYRSQWSSSVNVYYRWGNDIIDWVQQPGDSKWHSMQLTSLGTLGVEVNVSYNVYRGFIQSISASYGYINTSKSSGEYISKYALDYMKHKVSLNGRFNLYKTVILALDGTYYHRNGQYTNASGATATFEPYFLINSRITWNIKKFSIWGECSNILDQKYFDFGGIVQPGRWFMAGLRVRI